MKFAVWSRTNDDYLTFRHLLLHRISIISDKNESFAKSERVILSAKSNLKWIEESDANFFKHMFDTECLVDELE